MKQSKLLIGKHLDNDLVIQNLDCPNFLLELTKISPEQWELTLISKGFNVFINENPVLDKVVVQAGDQIKIDEHILTVEFASLFENEKAANRFNHLDCFAFELLSRGSTSHESKLEDLYLLQESGYYSIKMSQVVGLSSPRWELIAGTHALREDFQILLEDDELWVSSEKSLFQVNDHDTSLCQLYVGDELNWQGNQWKIQGPLDKCRQEKEMEEFNILSHLNASASREKTPTIDIAPGEMEAFRKKVNSWLSWQKNSLTHKNEIDYPSMNNPSGRLASIENKMGAMEGSLVDAENNLEGNGISQATDSAVKSVSLLSKHKNAIFFQPSLLVEEPSLVSSRAHLGKSPLVKWIKGAAILLGSTALLAIALFVL